MSALRLTIVATVVTAAAALAVEMVEIAGDDAYGFIDMEQCEYYASLDRESAAEYLFEHLVGHVDENGVYSSKQVVLFEKGERVEIVTQPQGRSILQVRRPGHEAAYWMQVEKARSGKTSVEPDTREQYTLRQPPPSGEAQHLPAFRVGGRDLTFFSIVVDPSITREQLATLVKGFRTARINGSLGQLFPATTPKGSLGSFAVIGVFVLSDSHWATNESLKAFMRASKEAPITKDFGKRIRAYYYYTALGPSEVGSIGYADDQVQTSDYEKLF